MYRKTILVLVLAAVTAFPAVAQSSSGSGDLGFRTWGLRIGIADDPDQVIGGLHFDFGEIVAGLRLQPDLEVGVGDDATTLAASVPVHYHFNVGESFDPYVGGGLRVALIDVDLPPGAQGDDSDTEIGAEAIAGLEWETRGGGAFFLELSVHFSDVHDTQLMAGWSF